MGVAWSRDISKPADLLKIIIKPKYSSDISQLFKNFCGADVFRSSLNTTRNEVFQLDRPSLTCLRMRGSFGLWVWALGQPYYSYILLISTTVYGICRRIRYNISPSAVCYWNQISSIIPAVLIRSGHRLFLAGVRTKIQFLDRIVEVHVVSFE